MKNKISYGKVYTDDSGKHMPNIFGAFEPDNISYKRLWPNVVDGFFVFKNTEALITAIQGNVRVIIAHDECGKYKFEQYYLSELDGKILKLDEETMFAVHNLDEGKSGFMIGTYVENLDVTFINSNIFNWRKKTP